MCCTNLCKHRESVSKDHWEAAAHALLTVSHLIADSGVKARQFLLVFGGNASHNLRQGVVHELSDRDAQSWSLLCEPVQKKKKKKKNKLHLRTQMSQLSRTMVLQASPFTFTVTFKYKPFLK